MRILVTGGRTYHDRTTVHAALEDYPDVEAICTGGADGADSLAATWAARRGVRCFTFKADWAAHGKKAGPLRNQRMLDEFKPDLVLAFPGGKGTEDCARRAEAAGVKVRRVP